MGQALRKAVIVFDPEHDPVPREQIVQTLKAFCNVHEVVFLAPERFCDCLSEHPVMFLFSVFLKPGSFATCVKAAQQHFPGIPINFYGDISHEDAAIRLKPLVGQAEFRLKYFESVVKHDFFVYRTVELRSPLAKRAGAGR